MDGRGSYFLIRRIEEQKIILREDLVKGER